MINNNNNHHHHHHNNNEGIKLKGVQVGDLGREERVDMNKIHGIHIYYAFFLLILKE